MGLPLALHLSGLQARGGWTERRGEEGEEAGNGPHSSVCQGGEYMGIFCGYVDHAGQLYPKRPPRCHDPNDESPVDEGGWYTSQQGESLPHRNCSWETPQGQEPTEYPGEKVRCKPRPKPEETTAKVRGCQGDQLSPAPPSISPEGARGNLGSGLPVPQEALIG